MTVILRGGTVVTRLYPPEVLAGDVVVEGDRVAAVSRPGPESPPGQDSWPGAIVIDCTDCLVIPGNVCAHTHAYSALARGMPYRLAPPRDFVEILRRVWWRLDRALDEETIRASARVAAMEALLAGTTTLVDHHASPTAIDGSLDVIAEEFARLGIRSILAYETSDRDGPDVAAAGLAENARFLARVAATRPSLVRGLVGAHASFTLSDATLEACADLARTAGSGIHVHVAEDAADERDAEALYGLRVVHRLDRAGALGPRSVLAHGVHLDPSEARTFRASGAALVHNPRSNMNNRVGRAPLGLLGSRVALGTDGIGADMFAESAVGHLRHVEESAVAQAAAATDDGTRTPGRHDVSDAGDAGSTDPAWPLARLAAGAALVGEAFGEPALGLIRAGAPADLVVLAYAGPTPVISNTLAGHWLFGLSSRAVRDVVVAGRVVVRDRRLTAVDEDDLAAAARVAATHLWERLDGIAEHPFVLEPVAVR